MRGWLRLSAVVLILCMTVFPAAAEALMRGSSGDRVRELQQRLFESGFLFELPDGKFGKNTEAAVKWFQEYAGLEQTGVADALTLDALTDCRLALLEEQGIYPGDNQYGDDPLFCNTWLSGDGTMTCDLCAVHAPLYADALRMLNDGTADSAEYAYLTWYGEVLSLYDRWAELVPGEGEAAVAASKALCRSGMESQFEALRESNAYGGDGSPGFAHSSMIQWMSTHAAWLCQMLSALE